MVATCAEVVEMPAAKVGLPYARTVVSGMVIVIVLVKAIVKLALQHVSALIAEPAANP